jgi:16S rRNA (guanine527-N7)-methyltransferase
LVECLGVFPPDKAQLILKFYELLLDENTRQNLTRLTSPEDFMTGHLQDVIELTQWGLVDYPAVDLGSGCGVPGLLSAVLDSQRWVLVESERRKAEFLAKTIQALGLDARVEARSERIENYLLGHSASSIVARAVGPVDRIYSWIHSCSTWNNLILFKGPSWDEEWERFSRSRFRKYLELVSIHSYAVGSPSRVRKLVKLNRVR